MPVLGHADGLCSIYIHSDADAQMAVDVIVDSKTDYPAACNAVETLLIHEDVLTTIWPSVARALIAKNVTLKCDSASKAALTTSTLDFATRGSKTEEEEPIIQDSTEKDYNTEFLDLILAIRTIPSSSALDSAISHINTHGSHHTECILTSSPEIAEKFQNAVDAACKFWNCSTRFCDGMRFGFGTEVGISTNKVHARGPVGLEGLTIHEYRLQGKGQMAASYAAGGGRRFTHRRLEI
jgi:glutamate-5-semialdehyde dehydrogenase